MSKFTVNFRAHYDADGCTDDEPTDMLIVNDPTGEVIEDAEFEVVEGLPESPGEEGFCEKVWTYQIADEHDDFFVLCLDNCPTVLSYK